MEKAIELRSELSFEPGVRYGLALSGGRSSSYLLAEAARHGADLEAYVVETAFKPTSDLDDAREMAMRIGVPLRVIRGDVFSHDEICTNDSDRCYHCRRFIFASILEQMAADGREALIDGTNATDDPARPGSRALAELGIISPLREAGYTEDDIRCESVRLGLFTADKPRSTCYAMNIPGGTRITPRAIGEVMLSGNPPYRFLPGSRGVIFSAPHSVVHVRGGRLKAAELDTGTMARLLNSRHGFPVLYKTGDVDDDPNNSSNSPYRDALATYVKETGAVAVVDLHQMVTIYEMLIELGTGRGENICGREGLVRGVVACFVDRGIVPVDVDSLFAASGSNTVSADISHRCGIPCFQVEMNSRLFLPRCAEYAEDETLDALVAMGKMLEEQG